MPTTLECAACGKVYTAPRFLQDHERKGCATSKRALSAILDKSKSLWEARKRRRLEASVLQVDDCSAGITGGVGFEDDMDEDQVEKAQSVPPNSATHISGPIKYQ
ncbi:hypothetical protein BKA70DRAFT_1218483 [Coprinopsis sp. MPI-PUGE-AT-0042]|nr:hypothetical protein BKA70DRAFT_1218483 [Coprinopsis sp. MPI-PUGE-AT-0042]